MKRLSKAVTIVASGFTALAISAIGVSTVFASSPGQLEGGPLVYQVRNVSQDGTYANTASANACNTLKYSVRLHNVEFGNLHNVVVKVNLPSNSSTVNTSTMTAVPDSGISRGTHGSVTVNLSSSQSISYISGTTKLFDVHGNLIRNLPEGITGSGVNAGTVNGSTTEFVQFQAKVSCPTPVPKPKPTPAPAQELPNTGPGEVAGLFAGASALGAAGHYIVARRRR